MLQAKKQRLLSMADAGRGVLNPSVVCGLQFELWLLGTSSAAVTAGQNGLLCGLFFIFFYFCRPPSG